MDRGETRIDYSHSKFKRIKGKRSNLFCNYCKKTGHSIEKCHKLYGFPLNSRFTGGRRTTTIVQVSDQENDHQGSTPQFPQTAVLGLTPE